VLDEHNQARKLIEREMLEMAIAEAESRVASGRSGLSLLLADGHAGVVGLSSSRIVERFGRPTFVFAPVANDATLITGSGRSIDEVHLRNALQWMADRRPHLFESPGTKMGGHRAAAGARVMRGHFEEFEEAFDLAVRAQVGDTVLGPCRWSDGELRPEEISLETVTQLELLEPTGRGFEPARFDGQFLVDDVRAVGDGTHLKLGLRLANQRYSGIWFKARASKDAPLPVEPRELAHFVFGLQANEFRGERRLDLVIEARVN
jgi:single-stranded-DNA-specific exonuclease